jgi:Toxin SymE, type I toxin-antitoxin system
VTVGGEKRDSLLGFLIPLQTGFHLIRKYHSPYKTMNTRNLKIESAGDFWRDKVSPKIRLSGRWLEQAGFKPGHRVEVEISQPGTLTLRFLDQSSPRR